MTGKELIQQLRALTETGQSGCPICGGHMIGTECEDCGTDFERAAQALSRAGG